MQELLRSPQSHQSHGLLKQSRLESSVLRLEAKPSSEATSSDSLQDNVLRKTVEVSRRPKFQLQAAWGAGVSAGTAAAGAATTGAGVCTGVASARAAERRLLSMR